MQAPDSYYADETLEWEELMRALDAHDYQYDASGSLGGTEWIDLHTPGGRYPTIEQARRDDGEPIGWTITFDFEEEEEPRSFTVRRICDLIDLIESN